MEQLWLVILYYLNIQIVVSQSEKVYFQSYLLTRLNAHCCKHCTKTQDMLPGINSVEQFQQAVAVWQCITVYYGVTRSVHSTCVLSEYSSVTELIVYHSKCELWCVPNSTKPITCISVTL